MRAEIENPICVALDTPTESVLRELVTQTVSEVGMFKVGLTTMYGVGVDVIRDIEWRRPLFVDAKLHDIPAQVRGAAEALRSIGADYVTVHASGGSEMVRAAVEGTAGETAILGVTILTSLDDAAIAGIGFSGAMKDAVRRLADVAIAGGADGLVCSPHEVDLLRQHVGEDPVLVVPGIRPQAVSDDQRRVMTPVEALRKGADYLVIGRPITGADDAAGAARSIRSSLAA